MNDTALTGELLLDDGVGTVRLDDVYGTRIDDLWDAITSPARVGRWLGTVTGELRLGATLQLSFVSGWDGPARIEVCEAPRHLVLVANPGQADETRMTAELTAEGARTRLVIEESGFTIDALPFHGSGWQTHVEDLRSYLEGRATSHWETRWKELTPAYLELAERIAR
ncbi:SRPBCC domain-containing protein [Microbacterium deminutum]|uniref:Activator of Hsp90 ATPase homologue 1/2-like C-terminal domain-containing protein n=1 Tax=Microbacterium deminutum TaxID=344164 RepID=A0ABP5CE43_9MICO